MTSKERAALRAESHHLDPIFQIGKGGLSEAFYKQVDEALTTRELIKVRVLLETTPISPKGTVVLDKTPESSLDCKETKPVNP